MKKELDEALCKKYPEIFCDRNKSPQETLMCFGFECGDGWYYLIASLCAMIQWSINGSKKQAVRDETFNKMLLALRAGDDVLFKEYYSFIEDQKRLEKLKAETLARPEREIKPAHQVVAVQVKEKFGGLRFYVNSASVEIYAMLNFAEHLSYSICEFCGSMKNIKHSKGWIITACQECIDTHENLKTRIWE